MDSAISKWVFVQAHKSYELSRLWLFVCLVKRGVNGSWIQLCPFHFQYSPVEQKKHIFFMFVIIVLFFLREVSLISYHNVSCLLILCSEKHSVYRAGQEQPLSRWHGVTVHQVSVVLSLAHCATELTSAEQVK